MSICGIVQNLEMRRDGNTFPYFFSHQSPVIRWRNACRLNVSPEYIVDEAGLARTMIPKDEDEGHFRRMIAARIELFQWSMHIVVQRLNKTAMQFIAFEHYFSLDLPIE